MVCNKTPPGKIDRVTGYSGCTPTVKAGYLSIKNGFPYTLASISFVFPHKYPVSSVNLCFLFICFDFCAVPGVPVVCDAVGWQGTLISSWMGLWDQAGWPSQLKIYILPQGFRKAAPPKHGNRRNYCPTLFFRPRRKSAVSDPSYPTLVKPITPPAPLSSQESLPHSPTYGIQGLLPSEIPWHYWAISFGLISFFLFLLLLAATPRQKH